MWFLNRVDSSSDLWFSDGGPIKAIRGHYGESSRLIVDRQGFLDLTEISGLETTILDANGSVFYLSPNPERNVSVDSFKNRIDELIGLSLVVGEDGSFTLSLIPSATSEIGTTSKTWYSLDFDLLREQVFAIQSVPCQGTSNRCQTYPTGMLPSSMT